MPYTLAKWIVWLSIAALIGGVIGYLLRSLRRDRAAAGAGASPDPAAARADAQAAADRDELAQLRAEGVHRDAQLDELVAERDRLFGELADCRSRSVSTSTVGFAATAPTAPELSDDAMAAGAALLARPLRRDDLTVVEGIGPKIADLLVGAGIADWWGLSNADVSALRTVLDDGGPTFRIHDPGTWPTQAGLLAHGRWAEFKELTDRLDGGRA